MVHVKKLQQQQLISGHMIAGLDPDAPVISSSWSPSNSPESWLLGYGSLA